ncbi:MAG: polysaccharide deacetylase family protein [Firmicutes bacterium]|nr:polysaccharide deacetylase family protein [Alicyclobacillaceae bacterium]MCL6496528.1 polysaccharide deacetylase family protein [Bacillota bacterium]
MAGALALGWSPRSHAALATSRTPGVIRQVITSKKVVALTFDDGPTRRWTPQILAILTHDKVPATFFVVGSHALRHPTLIQDEVRAGMEIASHGSRHLVLRGKDAATIRREVEENAAILKSLGAPAPTLYRLPAGQSDRTALTVLHQMGYQVIGWTIDTRDWRRRYSAQQMVDLVLKQIEPGSIIIFHDGPNSSDQTVAAVRALIPALRERGYQFLTVSQMLKEEVLNRDRLGDLVP